MSNVLLFAPRRPAVAAVSLPIGPENTAPTEATASAPANQWARDVPPSREVVEWCLMILEQTDESKLRIPLSRSYSQNTIYEVICDFAARGWTVTTDGPLALNFCRK